MQEEAEQVCPGVEDWKCLWVCCVCVCVGGEGLLIELILEKAKFTCVSVIYSLKSFKMAQRKGTKLESKSLDV